MQRSCTFDDESVGLKDDEGDKRCGAVFDDEYYSVICPHDKVPGGDVIPLFDGDPPTPMTREQWDTAHQSQDFGDEVDIRTDGILWMLNRTVFHPRGFALGINEDRTGLFLTGDGLEPWRYDESMDTIENGLFNAFEAMLERRRENAASMKDDREEAAQLVYQQAIERGLSHAEAAQEAWPNG